MIFINVSIKEVRLQTYFKKKNSFKRYYFPLLSGKSLTKISNALVDFHVTMKLSRKNEICSSHVPELQYMEI